MRTECVSVCARTCARVPVCVCVHEMEVILCSRDDPLRGCLAGGEQVCRASGFHHVFQLFHLHLFPQVLYTMIKTLY